MNQNQIDTINRAITELQLKKTINETELTNTQLTINNYQAGVTQAENRIAELTADNTEIDSDISILQNLLNN